MLVWMNRRLGFVNTNPYLAGIGLGLVLLSAYVLMGRGLTSPQK